MKEPTSCSHLEVPSHCSVANPIPGGREAAAEERGTYRLSADSRSLHHGCRKRRLLFQGFWDVFMQSLILPTCFCAWD